MRKKLLIVLGVLAVLFLGFAVVVAMQPTEFRYARATTMAAPPEAPFAQVNDFHKWENWSPWARLDPNMKTTFEGPSSGKGAKYAWSGNDEVGEGRMTIVESRPHELIRVKLEFLKPFAATNMAEFTFKSEDEQTKVEWAMTGEKGFVQKGMCLFMDMDAMMGAYFEKGLAQMKSVAEAEATAPTGQSEPGTSDDDTE